MGWESWYYQSFTFNVCEYHDMIVTHGDGLHSMEETCFVYVGMYEHWHDPVSLRADLGTLGEHMLLEHVAYVSSYVGVVWLDAWFMGAFPSCLCCRCHSIYYVLHYMVRTSGYER